MRIINQCIKKHRVLKSCSPRILLAVIGILLMSRWCALIFTDLLKWKPEQRFNSDDLKSLLDVLKKNYRDSLVRIKNITQKIGILVVSDKSKQETYSQFSAALYCYAISHGYIFKSLDPIAYALCEHIPNFFFRKHCAVLDYLMTHPEIGWLMVLDGDNVLVNASKQIEEYIPDVPDIYVVHSERFYNGEISAGNYLIYNCQWSHMYLLNWINMYRILPSVPYHNHDNGALHIHFALSVGKMHSDCFYLWYRSVNETDYDRYVGCIKCAIAGQRRFTHIWLLRRGHAFARDYREPENTILQTDFLIHGFKNDSSHYYRRRIMPNVCRRKITYWSLPIRSEMLVTNRSIAQALIRYYDIVAQQEHPDSIGIADVYDCWPFCQPNFTGKKEHMYLKSLCKSN